MPIPHPNLNTASISPDERYVMLLANDAYCERLDVATHALAGILANPANNRIAGAEPKAWEEATALCAIAYADALLEALAQPRKEKP